MNFLPNNINLIIVKNVLFELANATKKVFPNSDIDYPDLTLNKPSIRKYRSVKFGNNVFVGKNVKIGKKSIIGSNTIIEHDVVKGKNV